METPHRALRGRSRPLHERVLETGLGLGALGSVLTTAALVLMLVGETAGFFTDVEPGASPARLDIAPLLVGTLVTTSIALAVAVPCGLLAAVYLSELSSAAQRRLIEPLLALLGGVPTIVYGYVALVWVTPALQTWLPGLRDLNALAPGLVLGVMILPTIASIGDGALGSVPTGLREAAFGLGATRLGALFRVVLPTAASSLGAAVSLAAGRALGETMIVTIAAGQQPRLGLDPRLSVETMTTYLVALGQADVPGGGQAHRSLFVVGVALFLLTLAATLLSLRLTRRPRPAP